MADDLATNEITGRQLFNARRYYNQFYNSTIPEYLDTWDKRYFYGRVDKKFNSIMVKNEGKLQSINQSKNVKALNFVVDAFEDFKRYIGRTEQRLLFTNASNFGEDHFLRNLSAKKGWANARIPYADFMKTYHLFFLGSYVAKYNLEQKIKNIDDYIKYFMEFYLQGVFKTPITRTNFVLSKLVPLESSGLCIDIAEDNATDDNVKANKYFDDPGYFELYVNTARRFGFLVDQRAPWRLIANIGSPNMLKYIERRCGSAENLFKEYYVKNYEHDIDELRNYMIIYYNKFATDVPTTSWADYVSCSTGIKRTVNRVSRRVFNVTNESKFRRETKKIIQMKKYLDKQKVLDYINDNTKTTYRKITVPPGKTDQIENIILNSDRAGTPETSPCEESALIQVNPAPASGNGTPTGGTY